MNVNEAGEALQISSRSIYRLIEEGLLPVKQEIKIQTKKQISLSVDDGYIQNLVDTIPLGDVNVIRKLIKRRSNGTKKK